ncbi:unnamed protein product, partial [Strongylus vulgaris]
MCPPATIQLSGEDRVAIVKELFRNAKEDELTLYPSLLAEGNFASAAFEKKKNRNNADQLSKEARMIKYFAPSSVGAAALNIHSPAQTK